MTYLSQPPPNMNSIREVCNSLGADYLTSFVGHHWATGGLPVNWTSEKGGIISADMQFVTDARILSV